MKISLRNTLTGLGLCGLAFALVACQSKEVPIVNTTPYAVGSSTVFIHDDTRSFDAVAGVNSGVRTLITEIWYPVAHDDISDGSVRATYGDYVFGNREVHRKMMTQTTFFHLTLETVREGVSEADIDAAIEELFNRQRGSFVDAPVAKASAPWPVVVMSHGDAGSRYNMQSACEYLASHGYIVIAPEHTGNSPYTMIGMDPALAEDSSDVAYREQMADVLPLLDENGAYGEEASYGQSYTPLSGGFEVEGFSELDRSLVERVNDLRAAMTTLDEMNEHGPFAGRIDMSKVGLMGRSFGGATTLAGLMIEDRFTAGFAVVPPSLPDLRALLPKEMLVRAPQESAILAAEGSYALADLHKPTMLLSGGEDDLILGMGYQMATMMESTLPTVDNPYPVLENAFESADVPAIMAVVQNTNHGSFGVSGSYWFPSLKPGTFPMFFDKEREYTLLDSETAHRVQKEMVLAFFDLTIRGDESRLEILRANPWADYETRLEIRGF